MAQVKDPVCGMMLTEESAAARATHEGRSYHFCSEDCARTFRADPGRYAGDMERHEPPYTSTNRMTAPKFGSAGSGGLENEPAPEIHDRR